MESPVTLADIALSTRQQSILNVSRLVKLVEEYGYSTLPLLKAAAIEPTLLLDPRAKITLQQELSFVAAMLKTMHEPDMGFHAGQCYKFSAFGNLGMAVASCEKVEDAILLFLKYRRLSYTHFDISFFKDKGKAVLRFKDQYDLGELRQFYIERDFLYGYHCW